MSHKSKPAKPKAPPKKPVKPRYRYQGSAFLRYLSLAADAYARGTTPEEVECNAHPALVRLGNAAHKQNGGRE